MRKDNNSLSYTNMKGYCRLRRIRAVKPRFFYQMFESTPKGTVYHDGHVRSLYATSSKAFPKCQNHY